MSAKEQLIREMDGVPDFIAEEILNFCLFLKVKFRHQVVSTTSSDILDFLDDVETISQDVPVDKWETLPSDLSRNLDHYLYGAPKLEQ